MSEPKFCENCKWFESGIGYAFPYDRCSNQIAVDAAQFNLARRNTFAPCIDARSPRAPCGIEGNLFEAAPLKAQRISIFQHIRSVFFGKRL